MTVALFVRIFFWGWFAAAVAAGHWLVLQRLPPAAVPALVLALAAGLTSAALRVPSLRAWLETIDLRSLVLLHVSRLVGFYFLFLLQRDELPRAFALPGGLGEIVVGVMALPVVFAPLDDQGRQRAIRIWNVVGLIDILLVVFTITRLNLTLPWQLRPLTELPLSLYPTFLMPLLITTHVILLQRTSGDATPA
jgi:hypothetical protein